MCRNSFSGTRASCFWLAYPLWNGTHYSKLPTRGFNKELLCEQEGPYYWSWGNRTWGFLLLVLCPVCWTCWSNKWSDSLGGSVATSDWNRGLPVLTSVWQMVCPEPGRCGAPLGASQLCEQTLNKNWGTPFCIGWHQMLQGRKGFCSCCSETLLQPYTLIFFWKPRRLPSCFSAPQYFGGLVRSPKIWVNVAVR